MAVGVNVISSWSPTGINKAIKDFGRLQGAGLKTGFALTSINKGVGSAVSSIATFGSIAAVGLGAVGFSLVKTAEDALVADRVLLQVATSMGVFGSQTQAVVDRLSELASTQQLSLGIDEDVIKNTQAKLLTFSNLAVTAGEVGGAFDRATMAALDLAATGFGEATSNAVQLGKALQDPIKGITALGKAGVTFTAQEKEKIETLVKSGKMLEAQDTLLKAIETQVAGTAAASATSSAKIGLAFGEIAESLGSLLLPYFESFATLLNETVVPYVEDLVGVIGEEGLGAALQTIAGDITGFITNLGPVGTAVFGIVGAITALKVATAVYTAVVTVMNIANAITTAMGAARVAKELAVTAALAGETVATVTLTEAQIALNAAQRANMFGLIAAAIIAVIAIVVMLYLKFEVVRKVINFVINAIIGYIEFMANKWIDGFNSITGAINKMSGLLKHVGIDVPKIGELGHVAFGRVGGAAYGAASAVDTAGISVQQLIRNLDILAGAGGKLPITFSLKDLQGNVTTAQKDLKSMRASGKFDLEALKTATDNVSKAQADLALATGSGSGGAAKTVKTAAEMMKKYTDALTGSTDASRSLAHASQAIIDAQQKVKDAVQNTTDAQRAIKKANDDVTAAEFDVVKAHDAVIKSQRDLKDSHRDVTDAMGDAADAVLEVAKAQTKLKTASIAVTKAQKAFDVAVKGYGAGSKQGKKAQDALSESQRDAEGAGYDLEKAAFSVTDAEAELKAARLDATLTAQELRGKEIALAEAKIALVEAQVQERDATTAVTDAADTYDQMLNGVKTTSELYKTLLDDLNDAKKEEATAVEAVTKAREDEQKAVLAIEEALYKEVEAQNAVEEALFNEAEARTAVEDAKYAVTKATLEYEKSLRDEEAAIRDVADARYEEAKAIIAVAEAEAALAAAKKITPANLVKRVNTELAGAIQQATDAVAALQPKAKAPAASDFPIGSDVLDFSNLLGLDFSGFTMMAHGGIVTSPTAAIIGERGAEAVIPLDRMKNGSTININVNAGMGADSSKIGDAIVDALRKYERRNGSIPITVSN